MATVTTRSAVTIRASVPARVQPALLADECRGTVLARFPTALYVEVPRAFGVIALLTRDAVRLPCGLQLATSSHELPLDGLPGPVRVGDGALRLGDVEVVTGRVVSLAQARRPAPSRSAVRAAERLVDVAAYAPAELSLQLLGRGGGLTPSGDDVIAGYLAAAAAYGLPADVLRNVVRQHAVRRTTALSAALLLHAAVGDAIAQVGALLDALCDGRRLTTAVEGLLAVGHSSGAALAAGVLTAARAAA